MALHEIIRRYNGVNISAIFPDAASRGIAVQLADDSTFELAQGDGAFAGFLTRKVTADGPVLGDHFYPGRLELPFKAGDEVSAEKADAFEAEGDMMITSGTGAISDSTAVGTPISFKDGKPYVAQSGDTVWFLLADNDMTPVEDEDNLRCRFEAVR